MNAKDMNDLIDRLLATYAIKARFTHSLRHL